MQAYIILLVCLFTLKAILGIQDLSHKYKRIYVITYTRGEVTASIYMNVALIVWSLFLIRHL